MRGVDKNQSEGFTTVCHIKGSQPTLWIYKDGTYLQSQAFKVQHFYTSLSSDWYEDITFTESTSYEKARSRASLVWVVTIISILCALRSPRRHTGFHFDPRPRTFKHGTLIEAIERLSAYLTVFFIDDSGADGGNDVGVIVVAAQVSDRLRLLRADVPTFGNCSICRKVHVPQLLLQFNTHCPKTGLEFCQFWQETSRMMFRFYFV